jgi:hypothetical protein
VKLKTFCRRIKPSLRATPTIKGAEQGVNATIVPGSAEERVEHAALMLIGLLSEPTDPFKKKVGWIGPKWCGWDRIAPHPWAPGAD